MALQRQVFGQSRSWDKAGLRAGGQPHTRCHKRSSRGVRLKNEAHVPFCTTSDKSAHAPASGLRYTTWCSVLSDESISVANCNKVKCLNAPFDAQCFPTDRWDYLKVPAGTCLNAPFGAQCFPTAYPSRPIGRRLLLSQCTFWCSVLSDPHRRRAVRNPVQTVSMHLLVLSAFRRIKGLFGISSPSRVSMHLLVLSAFRPSRSPNSALAFSVSMHLLVLSAFRLDGRRHRLAGVNVSMHLLVLSAFRQGNAETQRACLHIVSMHLLVLSAFRHHI